MRVILIGICHLTPSGLSLIGPNISMFAICNTNQNRINTNTHTHIEWNGMRREKHATNMKCMLYTANYYAIQINWNHWIYSSWIFVCCCVFFNHTDRIEKERKQNPIKFYFYVKFAPKPCFIILPIYKMQRSSPHVVCEREDSEHDNY